MPELLPVTVLERKVLQKNDAQAAANRRRLEAAGVLTVNLMSAPGSGKTRLLEATLDRLRDRLPVCVIEGDVQTDNDARRIARHGAPVVQLITNGQCHLEAALVSEALDRLPLRGGILVIENVGNLVCPASFDLGESLRAVCVSVTEGDDKPEKYPAMFRKADVVVLTKIDLLPHVDFQVERVEAQARALRPGVRILRTSAVTGEGLDAWCGFLLDRAGPLKAAED
jgi:hydrogenase nickel incorporation protein HypB